ncbi:unnamed protein product [Mytilus coruscus]|uniref:Uncharacterized protein n=1 Tax=Mytilus coruscus TaxID=42192 RepID=A0A6J8AVY2_MYTCO|nr:unnamed protein product [Mytilus coruscus]
MKVKSNVDILNILMDFYNQNCSTPKLEERINPIDNSGQDDQDLFVCSKQILFELVRLSQWYGPLLEPTEMTKIGHVARLVVKPVKTTSFPIFCHSSSVLKQDFTVNYKLIHSYLCAGMFPAQYERFSSFANIGLPQKRFREKCFFRQVVISLRDKSIDDALKEEKKKFLQ